MRAARLEDGHLHIRDLPVPEPGWQEALIRIRAAGVCHSDLHIARGDWQGLPRSGLIGHEAIGVVEALGPGGRLSLAVTDRLLPLFKRAYPTAQLGTHRSISSGGRRQYPRAPPVFPTPDTTIHGTSTT